MEAKRSHDPEASDYEADARFEPDRDGSRSEAMTALRGTPRKHGYFFPAEWERHEGTWIGGRTIATTGQVSSGPYGGCMARLPGT